jgi:TolB-like protein/class 3 adenylate cyclase/Tfp pilus assembly protein PilF
VDPERVERRLAAIMFTDIVGYTALMAENEETGLRARERHRAVVRPLVEQHHGEFIEARGDESLSVFPSALDAVRCALAIQAALGDDAELKLHIGIHLGDVVMEGGEVSGDGINIASRICSLSEGAGVYVSGEVYQAVRNQPAIEAVSLGRHELRNVGRPVSVFAVGAPGTVSARRRPARALRTRAPLRSVAAGLALVALVALAWWVWSRAGATPEPIRSLVVLPLENLSGDPEQEYFADGMTEALIAELGTLGELRLISRTSAMRYKHTEKSLPEIAAELGVDAVVEGSILRAGDRVRITAQLIHAPADRHLWAASYQRDLRDILVLQSEVARAIAEQIALELTPGQRTPRPKARAVHPDAHEAYLRGRYFFSRHSPEGYRRAIEQFEAAIELDPKHAPAHAGLAISYLELPTYAAMYPREAMARGRAAALRALELDASLAEAHAALGLERLQFAWAWSEAEAAFERAIELNPSHAMAHAWYSRHLAWTGRFDEAIVEAQKARDLDPLSLQSNTELGGRYVDARRYEAGVRQLQQTLELDPDYILANLWLGWGYAYQSRYDAAIAQVRRAVEASGQDVALWPELAYMHARAGQREEALQILERVLDRSRTAYVWPTLVAEIYVALGDHDRCFEWLERAYRERDELLAGIAARHSFDDVRSDPRYAALMHRLDLPVVSD